MLRSEWPDSHSYRVKLLSPSAPAPGLLLTPRSALSSERHSLELTSYFVDNDKEDSTMQKYLLAAVLVMAFAAPALAEQFYIAYDGKRCEMMSHKPPSNMNVLGNFGSKHAAEKAMADMKQCK
jgi:hypothetical protein